MWILIISLYAHYPLGQTQSKGIIHVPMQSIEQCYKERDTVNANWRIDKYKTSARCIWIKEYSRHNGAYTRD